MSYEGETSMSKALSYGRAHCKNKDCETSWDSITQLRKARVKAGTKGALCPECQQPLTKREALGAK
jgi:hypothetical protein